jgi:uncharacterized protein (UPF0303 family)
MMLERWLRLTVTPLPRRATIARVTSAPDATVLSTISEIEDQEGALVFTRFDNDDAWRLGCLLVGLARERGLGVTIDIRRGTQQLFHAALPGTTADNDEWVQRKARVVQRFGASSYLVGLRSTASGSPFAVRRDDLPAALFAAHGGSFPIRIVDVGVVGAVTVSGLPQADDHALVVEALGVFLS